MALRRIAESRNRKHGKDEVLQQFGTVYPVPIGLGENVRASTSALNPLLANTMVLRDLYKSITGRSPAQPFTNRISSLISTTTSKWS